MAQNAVSRAPARGSLAEVAAGLRADTALPHRRRQEMLAALNTVARVLGRGLDQILCEPARLSRRLAEANPAAHHVASRRWNNVRSLVRTALQRGVPVAPSRRTKALGPRWQALWEALPIYQRPPLSRLMRFCDERGILPEGVDQTAFAEFRGDIQHSLRKNPEAAYVAACRVWNRAADNVPGWPPFRIAIQSRYKAWTLPWSAFPPSLQREVQVWLDRLAGWDPLYDLPFRPVCAATVRTRDYQLRQAASALVCRGQDPQSITGLADLVAFGNFKEILRHLIERRGGLAGGQVGDIAMLLKSIARHQVKVPADVLDAMAAVVRRIEKRRRGMTEANRTRLRPLDERGHALALVQLPSHLLVEARHVPARPKRPRIVGADELYALGQRLMAAATQSGTPRQQAINYRDGLLITFLAARPLRRRNLAGMRIDETLVQRDGSWWIDIPGQDTKTGLPIAMPLPDDLCAAIDSYLALHRPVLEAMRSRWWCAPGRMLWLSSHGSPMTQPALYDRVVKVTRAALGRPIHPHLFRDCAATSIAVHDPDQVRIAAPLLGHRTLNSSEQHYNQARTREATLCWQKHLLDLRRANPPSAVAWVSFSKPGLNSYAVMGSEVDCGRHADRGGRPPN